MPEVSLAVAPEHGSDYDRDDWGPHNSDLCRGATGSPDPYTGTPIDICNVDHVVALYEAHQSGGWAWPIDMKQGFSQDPTNEQTNGLLRRWLPKGTDPNIGAVRLAIIEDRLNTMPRKLHDWHSAHSVYAALTCNDR